MNSANQSRAARRRLAPPEAPAPTVAVRHVRLRTLPLTGGAGAVAVRSVRHGGPTATLLRAPAVSQRLSDNDLAQR
jgi:hypothetical protein